MTIKHPKLREATTLDLPVLLALLDSDSSHHKHSPLSGEVIPHSVQSTFEKIQNSAEHLLIVAEIEDHVIAMMQLSFIPYISYQGSLRMIIEGLRVNNAMRSQGIGSFMLEQAIQIARNHKCNLVQLTSNKDRGEARRFYRRHGFIDSHNGFKLYLR